MNQQLTIKAPAKVNLALDVVGKRIDGFHDLKMINHAVSLADELELIPNTPYDIITDFDSVPVSENLITKALLLLSQVLGRPINFSIRLDKNIPEKAGLGGGSTDAAAAMILALKHWNEQRSINELKTLALKIGSDVPYSLFNDAALVEGIGEQISFINPIAFKKVVIIHPDIKVNSKKAYHALDNEEYMYHPDVDKMIELLEKEDYKSLREIPGNTFTPFVAKEYPVINDLIDRLYDLGAEYATMSGSGPTIVGYFNDQEKAEKAIDSFEDYEVYLADLL